MLVVPNVMKSTHTHTHTHRERICKKDIKKVLLLIKILHEKVSSMTSLELEGRERRIMM